MSFVNNNFSKNRPFSKILPDLVQEHTLPLPHLALSLIQLVLNCILILYYNRPIIYNTAIILSFLHYKMPTRSYMKTSILKKKIAYFYIIFIRLFVVAHWPKPRRII